VLPGRLYRAVRRSEGLYRVNTRRTLGAYQAPPRAVLL